MKQINKNLFRPNILLIIIGVVIALFFTVLLTFIILDKSKDIKILELLIILVIYVFFIKLFINCIDAWTVKIEKGKILIKRIWSRNWLILSIDNFEKIKYSVKIDDYTVSYKKLTIYTFDKKKYNFYSYTDTMNDQLYLALLNQSPKLLEDYEKRKKEFQNKIEARKKNEKWILIILLIVLIVLWTMK